MKHQSKQIFVAVRPGELNNKSCANYLGSYASAAAVITVRSFPRLTQAQRAVPSASKPPK